MANERIIEIEPELELDPVTTHFQVRFGTDGETWTTYAPASGSDIAVGELDANGLYLLDGINSPSGNEAAASVEGNLYAVRLKSLAGYGNWSDTFAISGTAAESQARLKIETLTKSGSYPTLSRAEVDYLLTQAKRADSSGRAPSATGWEGTWAIAYAVAIGWELKAAQVAADFDFESAGQKFSRSQIHKMCLEQAKQWRKRGGNTTIDVGPAGVEYDYTEVLV